MVFNRNIKYTCRKSVRQKFGVAQVERWHPKWGHQKKGSGHMRNLVKFGATMTIILYVVGGISGLANFSSAPTWLILLGIVWDVGYIFLLYKLGAWGDQTSWNSMGEGRKFLLLLLTLPGILGGIWFIIILFFFGVFGEKAAIAGAKSEVREQVKSDVETAVRKEFDRRGY